MGRGKMRNPQIQTKRGCIFCGQTPLTEEHFWPSWMNEKFSISKDNAHVKIASAGDASIIVKLRDYDLKKMTGPIRSWKLKVVCATCNNRWMSEIEDAVKPILNALAAGEPVELDREDQETLAKWAYLKSLVGEHDQGTPEAVISAAERSYFRRTRSIPQGWKFWIARIKSPVGKSFYHSNTISIRSDLNAGGGLYITSKSTMFTLGELIIHCVNASTMERTCGINYMIIGDYGTKFKQIFPKTAKRIKWSSFETIYESDLDLLRHSLGTFADAVKTL